MHKCICHFKFSFSVCKMPTMCAYEYNANFWSLKQMHFNVSGSSIHMCVCVCDKLRIVCLSVFLCISLLKHTLCIVSCMSVQAFCVHLLMFVQICAHSCAIKFNLTINSVLVAFKQWKGKGI